ncbi:general stress protein [Spongisporangium articulatum]|uniref:General stress protein n=1 Tax=Spongisporangium articulatum TaxID=3362603 RepID=A0ABW8AQ02_9ACTN
MSNLGPTGAARPGLPTPPRGDTIASYRTYVEAQRAVDYLSDQHFPVQSVTIVGVDLQMVERVTGRLTYPRVAMSGLFSGAYFGAMIGFLLLIIGAGKDGSWLAAIPLGAAFGLAYALLAYSLTGGRRDFSSTSQIVATEYRVLCLPEQAGRAMNLLRQLEGGTGLGASTPQPYPPPPPTQVPAGGWGTPPSAPAPQSPADETPAPAPTGPTYGEMIEKKRREEREAAERAARGEG